MKRILIFILSAVFLTVLLAGCKASPTPAPSGSSSPSSSSSPASSSSSSPGSSSSPSSSAGSAKLGLAVMTSLSKSTEAGATSASASPSPSASASASPSASASASPSASPSQSPAASASPSAAPAGSGLAEVDSTIVAVTVDKDGKIQQCVIDAVQAKINFDAKGKLLTPPTTTFKTKNELGDAYGMKKASGIGKEWYEQAKAFAEYVEGKTVDEIKNIKVDERNYPTTEDLKASVTISIGGFIDAIEKAVKSAQNGGAAASDKLSIGVVSTMSKSTDAASDKDGLAELDSTFAAVTRDNGGKITSCIVDATQSKISFNVSGKITSDTAETPKSKNEMGQSYGMKKASGIGKEWNEQAQAFAKYVTGKTPEEIKGIAVDEKGYAVASDIKSSVTISIGDFKGALMKATASA